MATGKLGFLEMAVDMALSLRENTDLPIGLACDPGLLEPSQTQYGAVFDEVCLVPERFLGGRTRKYGVAEATPFEETTFIDADCVVLGSLDYVFDALERHDMAMLGQRLTREDDLNHHGFSTRHLIKTFGLEHYLKTNSGIFSFRKQPAIEIMEECRTCFLEEARPRLKWSGLLGRWLGDEIAFGIVGGRRDVGALPAPNPMYWPQEFDEIDLSAPQKPLLHFIWPPSEDVLVELFRGMRARRAQAGIPGDAEGHWRDEVVKLNKMKRRSQWLARIGWG